MKMNAIPLAITGLLFAVSAAPVIADKWDEATKVTFSAPVEVPGKVLPAGTYMFKLLDSPSDRNIVEIYNADQTKLEDLVLTIPDERLHPTGKTVMRFEEAPSGSPEVLKAWFYPGSTYGEQFVYPHDRASQIAKASHEPVFSTRSDLSSYSQKHVKSGSSEAAKMKSAPVRVVQPNGQETDVPAGKKEK